jgi:hypothetical protein
VTAVSRTAAYAAVVVCALVGALRAPQPAAAKSVPCWTKLLNDWYDGRIDNTYPVACYRDALKHLPDDVAVYSSARTDIQRALANAVRENQNDTETGANAPVPASTTPTTTSSDGASNSQNDATGGRDNSDDGPVGSALGSASDSADSIPTPLIILGTLAILLIAAGVGGVLVKRYQARHPGP